MKSGPIFILIAAVLWGLDGVLRRSLYDLYPLTIVFYEHLIGSALILPFAIRAIKTEKFNTKEWITMVVVSLLSGVLGTLWFTKALLNASFAPFSIVFLLQKLQPVFAVLTARILLKEKITISYAYYATLAVAAAYFVTFKDGRINWQQDIPLISTALLAVGAAFAWGSSTALSKYNLQNHPETTVTGLRFGLTTLMAGAGILIASGQFQSITVDHLSKLLMITCSTGLVALWLYYKGLKNTKAQIATILELAFPVTAVMIDLLLYQSTLSWSQYVGAGALIIAITKINKLNTK